MVSPDRVGGSDAGSQIAEGSLLGRYSLLTRLASGGMANVWLAQAQGAMGFQKTVVVKTLLPHLADDPDFVRMFINEAVLASRLQHPNVVSILDLGETLGTYHIVMEYVRGRTLRHVLRELKRTQRVPPVWFVLRIMAAVCDGLHYAHTMVDEHGEPMRIVHRDVTPENIMVTFTGDAKLLDFGIAKASNAAKTRSGVLKGKFAYMAPEQLDPDFGESTPDPRVDLYAAGVVLYELLTGRRPFQARGDLKLLRSILSDRPRPPAEFCPWISADLSTLVMRAMARAPSERFQSALELRQAIDAYFASTKTMPTPIHVVNYMAGLFGEVADETRRTPLPSSRAPLPEQTDPWNAMVEEAGLMTIDLSMVISCDEIASEEDCEPDPQAGVEADSSAEPDTAKPEAGPLPAQWHCAHPPLALDLDELWDDVPPASSSASKSTEDRRIVDVEIPAPSSTAPDIAAANAPSAPAEPLPAQGKPQPPRTDAEPRHRASPPPSAPSPDHGHAWDRAVQRLRRASSASLEAVTEPTEEVEKSASEWFDEGLACWRGRNLEGALRCWSTALDLEPDNRAYKSNVRKLERLLRETGTAGDE